MYKLGGNLIDAILRHKFVAILLLAVVVFLATALSGTAGQTVQDILRETVITMILIALMVLMCMMALVQKPD